MIQNLVDSARHRSQCMLVLDVSEMVHTVVVSAEDEKANAGWNVHGYCNRNLGRSTIRLRKVSTLAQQSRTSTTGDLYSLRYVAEGPEHIRLRQRHKKHLDNEYPAELGNRYEHVLGAADRTHIHYAIAQGTHDVLRVAGSSHTLDHIRHLGQFLAWDRIPSVLHFGADHKRMHARYKACRHETSAVSKACGMDVYVAIRNDCRARSTRNSVDRPRVDGGEYPVARSMRLQKHTAAHDCIECVRRRRSDERSIWVHAWHDARESTHRRPKTVAVSTSTTWTPIVCEIWLGWWI